MNAPSTALAVRAPTADTSPTVVVVAERTDIAGWVLRWCRRSGRILLVRPAAVTASDRIRAVAALAGSTVLVVPRALARPGPPRVVAAVQDLPDDALVLVEAAQIAAQRGGSLVVVHAVPLSFGERSVGLAAALDHGRWVLDTARDQLATHSPGLLIAVHLLRVWPHELVGEDIDADLLVIGGAHAGTPPRLGRVARSAMHHAPCPILLTPRPERSPHRCPRR